MGTIPHFVVTNGDGLRGWRPRLPRVDSLCSLKVARASKISGRKFSAVARRKRTGLNVCRNGCAEMQCGGRQWLPPRRAPFGRRAGQPSEGAPTRQRTVPVCWRARTARHLPLLGEERRLQVSARTRTRSLAVFSTLEGQDARSVSDSGDRSCGSSAAEAMRCGLRASTRGQTASGGCACPRADSLCDRMERGEEESHARRRDAFQRSHFCRR